MGTLGHFWIKKQCEIARREHKCNLNWEILWWRQGEGRKEEHKYKSDRTGYNSPEVWRVRNKCFSSEDWIKREGTTKNNSFSGHHGREIHVKNCIPNGNLCTEDAIKYWMSYYIYQCRKENVVSLCVKLCLKIFLLA